MLDTAYYLELLISLLSQSGPNKSHREASLFYSTWHHHHLLLLLSLSLLLINLEGQITQTHETTRFFSTKPLASTKLETTAMKGNEMKWDETWVETRVSSLETLNNLNAVSQCKHCVYVKLTFHLLVQFIKLTDFIETTQLFAWIFKIFPSHQLCQLISQAKVEWEHLSEK